MKWSEDDQDKAIAYTLAKAEVCEMCGSREEDWINPENRRIWDNPPLAPAAIKCFGCAEQEMARKAWFQEGGTPAGVRIVLVPSEIVDADGSIIN